jgi:hypothetical protein
METGRHRTETIHRDALENDDNETKYRLADKYLDAAEAALKKATRALRWATIAVIAGLVFVVGTGTLFLRNLT